MATPAFSRHAMSANTSWSNTITNAGPAVSPPPVVTYAPCASGPLNIQPNPEYLPQYIPASAVTAAPAFVATNPYVMAHPIPQYYGAQFPQSDVSPVAPSHEQFFYDGQQVSPVSSQGANVVSTAFPAFHLGPNTGNMHTVSAYPTSGQYTTAYNANYTLGYGYGNASANEARTLPVHHAHTTYAGEPVAATSMPSSSAWLPSTVMRAARPPLFQNQLPHGYQAYPAQNGQNILAPNAFDSFVDTPTSPPSTYLYTPSMKACTPSVSVSDDNSSTTTDTLFMHGPVNRFPIAGRTGGRSDCPASPSLASVVSKAKTS